MRSSIQMVLADKRPVRHVNTHEAEAFQHQGTRSSLDVHIVQRMAILNAHTTRIYSCVSHLPTVEHVVILSLLSTLS